MKTIHKFPFSVGDDGHVWISMPRKAEILSVQMQRAIPCIWALVDTIHEVETRTFKVYGTGRDLGLWPGSFVATFQDPPFVWHLFETCR